MNSPSENLQHRGSYNSQNQVKLVRGGREYFELLAWLISGAQHVVHLQVYIFEDDSTGQQVGELLMAAARRGVQVYLLVDGYASQRPHLSRTYEQQLKAAGIHFNRFEPLFKSRHFYFGRRLHHKLVVVDGIHALVGGINICDRYNSDDGKPPWFDLALYVNGETSRELELVCCSMWNDSAGKRKIVPGPALQQAAAPEGCTAASVRVRRNDWIKGKQQIWKSYANLIANAQEEIIIACSYFLPGRTLLRLMIRAAKRGVSVRVIVAGPTDVMIAKHAERYLYRVLLKHHIRVFEYNKSVLHAKVGLTDGKWMTIGSYNLNNISAYASIELNLDVRNQPFVSATRDQLENIICDDCTEITAAQYQANTGRLKRLWQYCCYKLIKTTLYLFTFYFKRELNWRGSGSKKR
jgi:cardiolipin synthase